MTDLLSDRNRLWAALERRAERAEELGLLPDYVELGDASPIFDPSSMVMFGRRGAGKTHALIHLSKRVVDRGDIAVYVDMRRISSNSGIYGDKTIAFGTRATNMLVDIINDVHSELYSRAALSESGTLADNLHILGPALDELGYQATRVRVTGDYTRTRERSIGTTLSTTKERVIDISRAGIGGRLGRRTNREVANHLEETETEQGQRGIYIHLGQLDRALHEVSKCLGGKRLWILIDEWSEGIPYELQPILADMLRRTFMRVGHITVKIAAIEHRSNFLIDDGDGDSIGLELGSDTAETLSLDASLVLKSDVTEQTRFLQALLNEHYLTLQRTSEFDDVRGLDPDPIEASCAASTFEWLVRASEGNPRDAMNLVSKAARRAGLGQITSSDVLMAASEYFWDTKYKNIEGNRDLERLYGRFMEMVLRRGRRTILISRTHAKRRLIDKLYDRRLIHLLQSGLRPATGGGLYDAYAVDFGSYSDRVVAGTMRWSNDGWMDGRAFNLSEGAENWETAVLRHKLPPLSPTKNAQDAL